MRGKKGSQYDGGHRVPCFLHWPAGGLDKPVDVNRLAAHIDLLPTLVELCSLRLPRPATFDGASLRPLLQDPKADWPDRSLVLGTPRNNVASAAPPTPWESSAVMTDRWRLVNRDELYDMPGDPGQKHNLAGQNPDVVDRLRKAYDAYWAGVSAGQENWQGRPIVGTSREDETRLCSETWTPTRGRCPWSQAAVAAGEKSFGLWPIRVSEAGSYRIEVRRWPRELDTPMGGLPAAQKTVDAYLAGKPVNGTLYSARAKALPVAKVRLKIGPKTMEANVAPEDTEKVFTAALDAGPTEIEAILLNAQGQEISGAYYVYVRKS